MAAVGGGRDLGRLFGKTLGYYVLSSGLAALAGKWLVDLAFPHEPFVMGIGQGQGMAQFMRCNCNRGNRTGLVDTLR